MQELIAQSGHTMNLRFRSTSGGEIA